MVAVGLWGAQLGAPAIWLLPVTFPLVMALGAVAGLIGVPLPHAVAGVALSGVILGALVASAARPRLWIAALIVAAFAVFHGHTHGTALPLSGVPLAFGAGFVISTGLLHLCGIAIGLLNRRPAGAQAIRLGGIVIAVTGGVYLARYVLEHA
jgi:urease accessory protein